MANQLEIEHIGDARARTLKERTATKTRITSFLDLLAKFRNINSVQIVIEFFQILGIGIWIWTDISPDFGTAAPPSNSWFQIPDGPKILLGLFFTIDAVLILNAALRTRPKDEWKVVFGVKTASKDTCRPITSEEIDSARSHFEDLWNTLGELNPRTVTAQFRLVKTLNNYHQHETAIALCRDLVTMSRNSYGHAAQETLNAENFLNLCIIQEQSQCATDSAIDWNDIVTMRETLAHRASELPSKHREVLRAEELLFTMLQLSGASSLEVRAVFEDANRKKLIDLDHLQVEDAASSVATKAIVTFVLDCLLIVLASPFRALRVARPLMILRRMAVATEKEPNWRFPLLSRESFLVLQLGVLLIYSLGLVVLSIGDLIYNAERNSMILQNGTSTHVFEHLSSAIWYSVQTVTLVGSQSDPLTLQGRIYSVLLLFMGLGIVGLFGMLFQRIFGMSFLPKHVNHKKLLEDGLF
jgi:hypothetical protein